MPLLFPEPKPDLVYFSFRKSHKNMSHYNSEERFGSARNKYNLMKRYLMCSLIIIHFLQGVVFPHLFHLSIFSSFSSS